MRYAVGPQNDQNWLYLNSMAGEPFCPMRRSRSAEKSDAALDFDPVTLRADWVPACEAAVGLASPKEFMGWMEDFIRPLLGYRLLACGTGVFLARMVSVERLLVRGIRLSEAERLRDAFGTVILPRGMHPLERALSDVDIESLALRAWGARRPQRVADATSVVMERALGTHQSGSYFLFGALERPLDARSRYDLALIAPHMHDALARALARVPERQRSLGKSEKLTRTERELLGYLVAGHTTPEIAQETFRSVHTVANHVRAIRRKLCAKNRTEAISKALSQGLVESVAAAPHTRIIAAQPVARYRVARKRVAWRGIYRPIVMAKLMQVLLPHPCCA